MPVGVILLLVVSIAVYLGFAERAIARMGISKQAVLLFFVAMIAGSFIDIPLRRAPLLEINVGGALVPIGLAGYLLTRVENRDRFVKIFFSVLLTGATIFALTQLYQFEEGQTIIDSNYLFPLVAGTVAYLTGRSRRAAFIGGTLGFLVYDLFHLAQAVSRGVRADISIGGAGIFDSIVISGFVAVLLVEIIGETREELGANNGEQVNRKQFQADSRGDNDETD